MLPQALPQIRRLQRPSLCGTWLRRIEPRAKQQDVRRVSYRSQSFSRRLFQAVTKSESVPAGNPAACAAACVFERLDREAMLIPNASSLEGACSRCGGEKSEDHTSPAWCRSSWPGLSDTLDLMESRTRAAVQKDQGKPWYLVLGPRVPVISPGHGSPPMAETPLAGDVRCQRHGTGRAEPGALDWRMALLDGAAVRHTPPWTSGRADEVACLHFPPSTETCAAGCQNAWPVSCCPSMRAGRSGDGCSENSVGVHGGRCVSLLL